MSNHQTPSARYGSASQGAGSGQAGPRQQGGQGEQRVQGPSRRSGRGPSRPWASYIPALGVLGILVILVYVSQVPANVRWIVFGTAVAVAGAAALVGGIVGFLFGIPFSNKQRGIVTGGELNYEANTNLEQVSDWLTKIIVGVGLVQVGRALPGLGKLGESLKAPLGGQPSSSTFGLGLVIFYTLLGFLYLYLWSRQVLPLQLPAAVERALDEKVPPVVQKAVDERLPSVVQKQLGKNASAESDVPSLVNRQRGEPVPDGPNEGGPGRTEEGPTAETP
jgi:hypothetical protein